MMLLLELAMEKTNNYRSNQNDNGDNGDNCDNGDNKYCDFLLVVVHKTAVFFVPVERQGWATLKLNRNNFFLIYWF